MARFKKAIIEIPTLKGTKPVRGYRTKSVRGIEIFIHATQVGWLARLMDGRRLTPFGSETRLKSALKANSILTTQKHV